MRFDLLHLPDIVDAAKTRAGCISPNWESQPCSVTCPHTSHADQPPLWEPREHQHHSVSRLQATGTLQHISRLPGLLSQLFKAPLDLCSCTINAPEGRDWGPVPSLESCTGKKEKNPHHGWGILFACSSFSKFICFTIVIKFTGLKNQNDMKRYTLRRLLPHCAYPKIHTILCPPLFKIEM